MNNFQTIDPEAAAIYYSCLFIQMDNTKYPTKTIYAVAETLKSTTLPTQRYKFRFDTSLVKESMNTPRDKAPIIEVTFDIGRNHRTQYTLEFTDEFYSIRQAIAAVEAYFNEELPKDDLAALKAADDILPNIHDFYPYRGSALGTLCNLRNRIVWCEYTAATYHLRIHCE